MYDILLTEAADQDLNGIIEYIAVKLSNPSAARAFLDSVEACYSVLRKTPLAYAECSDKLLCRKRY